MENITIKSIDALLATLPARETVPYSIVCGNDALYILSDHIKAQSSILNIYGYSVIIGLKILRDLALPGNIIEIRNCDNECLQRFELEV